MIKFQGKQFTDWKAARESMLATAPVVTTVAVAEPLPEFSWNAAQPAPGKSLTERYRPRKLSDLAGQSDIVATLQDYVAAPYSTAFIFAGETGTGKTSAAWSLAAELGCNLDSNPVEFGGVYSIASGEHNADSLRTVWPGLWSMPFESSKGWKVLICNEVETLSDTVEKLWLDKLENLPPSTAIIFTTNALETLPARFVDRCIGGVLEFKAAADDLVQPAQTLARSIWRAETGKDIPLEVMDVVVKKSIQAGKLSFRRVVQSLVPHVAKGK
jgi:replication-associated recombination protein RarA